MTWAKENENFSLQYPLINVMHTFEWTLYKLLFSFVKKLLNPNRCIYLTLLWKIVSVKNKESGKQVCKLYVTIEIQEIRIKLKVHLGIEMNRGETLAKSYEQISAWKWNCYYYFNHEVEIFIAKRETLNIFTNQYLCYGNSLSISFQKSVFVTKKKFSLPWRHS